MAAKESYVGWNPVIYIWMAQIWRIMAMALLFVLGIKAIHVLTPVFSYILEKVVFEYSKTTFLLEFLFALYITYWSLKYSLINNYSVFNLAVESKKTQRSMFSLSHTLSSNILLRVWWAQFWRTSIVTVAIIVGVIAAAYSRNQSPSSYLYLSGNKAVLAIDISLSLLMSIWATKESLADRYRRFRFIATRRHFYSDDSKSEQTLHVP